MKKRFLTLVCMLMAAVAAFAQTPSQLTYQSVVRDTDNRLVINSSVTVKITIQNVNMVDAPAANIYYSETHSTTTNQNGLVTLLVGSGTVVSGNYSDIAWAGSYIQTDITYNGNTTKAVTPVTAMPLSLDVDPSSHTLNTYYYDKDEVDNNIHDSLAPYQIKNCDDVENCVETAIANNSSEINNAIDTIVENHLLPYEIQNCNDVIACVDGKLADNSSTTNNAIDTIIENHLHPYEIQGCGDVEDCVETAIADNSSDINKAIDTIIDHRLEPYEIQDCDDVNACVKKAIADNTSEINNGIDTIVEHHLQPYEIRNCNDVKDCVADQIHDSIAAHPISNATITINDANGTTVGDFTLNQSSAETITLPAIPDAANDSQITIVDADGNTVGTFTLDQATAQTITLPAAAEQKSVKVAATASQTNFSLTVPTGKSLDATSHLVQMYINGVYVGDNTDGVVTVSGSSATYVPASNGNYDLVAGDRVKFVYWVK